MKFEVKWHLGNAVCELTPKKIEDKRGFFSEVYQKNSFEEIGIKDYFIQENHSFSKNKYTFRGLHFQKPPFEQAKLVRVLQGSIIDIAVDLRVNSETYLQHRLIDLSAKNFKQVYVPVGFAHGFLTLEENCEISYKVSNPYDYESDVSISIFDEELGIELPCQKENITISDKDHDGVLINTLDKIFFE
ncbi:dTDP-4-dehydrorhamnose 3,5-epimerase [Gammaproteobacteria bacterium]|nr:dTDP-4-dehydrorhamnose 3,5-epimerase [Gammaproteobacteria bacterium]